MENYIENYKKYNRLLFKFMNYSEDRIDYNIFTPHDCGIGNAILMLTIYKITQQTINNNQIKVLTAFKKNSAEVFIQEWYNTSDPRGYVNIVHVKEVSDMDLNKNNKTEYKEDVLKTMHRAIYNSCVDFIIKIS